MQHVDENQYPLNLKLTSPNLIWHNKIQAKSSRPCKPPAQQTLQAPPSIPNPISSIPYTCPRPTILDKNLYIHEIRAFCLLYGTVGSAVTLDRFLQHAYSTSWLTRILLCLTKHRQQHLASLLLNMLDRMQISISADKNLSLDCYDSTPSC